MARLGGDEFGLLLWVPDEEVTVAILERVRTALPGRYSRAGLPALTASVGYRLAGRGDPGAASFSAESLYAAADAALSRGQAGRPRSDGGVVRGRFFAINDRMRIHGNISINNRAYHKGDDIPWYAIYPFFLLHMLMFGGSGFLDGL